MSGLEYSAWLAISFLVIGFFVAWESESNFGAHLRHQARLTGWLLLGVAKKLIGWTLGAATLLMAPLSDKAADYHAARTYMPRH